MDRFFILKYFPNIGTFDNQNEDNRKLLQLFFGIENDDDWYYTANFEDMVG